MKKTKVVVKLIDESFNIEIEDIFDDPLMEACTRIIEYKRTLTKNFSIPPCIIASFDRKGSRTQVYNSYIILINAGMHKYAEVLRDRFMKDSGIDLQKEPVKAK